jgi:hypothetical protein
MIPNGSGCYGLCQRVPRDPGHRQRPARSFGDFTGRAAAFAAVISQAAQG